VNVASSVKITFWKKFHLSAIVAVPIDKLIHDFENRSHAVPGVMMRGRGETYDV
jgi:hypothetical protein